MNKLQSFIDSYGAARLARELRVSRGTVSHWRNGRFSVDPKRCLELAALSDGALTVHDIRADVFGPAPASEAA